MQAVYVHMHVYTNYVIFLISVIIIASYIHMYTHLHWVVLMANCNS